MNTALLIPLIIFGASSVLLVLSSLINDLLKKEQHQTDVANDKVPEPEETPENNVTPVIEIKPLPIPKEQRAGWWWSQLLTPKAVMGLLAAPFQPLILIINSYILSVRLETLLGNNIEPLFDLTLWSWNREITLYDLAGCLISIIQIASAAVFVLDVAELEIKKKLRWTALVVWLCGVGFELFLSIWSGLMVGGAANACLSALLALLIAIGEGLIGTLTIDFFIIPLVLSISWSIASPIRALAGWLSACSSHQQSKSATSSQKGNSVQRKSWLVSAIGILDTTLDPLRNLDTYVYNRLKPKA